MKITRDSIVKTLQTGLKNNPSVYAFWLEGSEATNRVDKYSDLDIWFDVKDGFEEHIAQESIKLLQRLSPVDFLSDGSKPHPQIWHYCVHLQGTPKTLVIDLCIQSHSRKYVFTKGLSDDKIKVIFDKNNTIKYLKLDIKTAKAQIKKRIDELDKTYDFYFDTYYYKNILRNNFIEALYYYQRYVIEPIIVLCRIKHCPDERGDLCFKHIADDLPKQVVKTIEYYYKVNSVKEMGLKSRNAKILCRKLINDLKGKR